MRRSSAPARMTSVTLGSHRPLQPEGSGRERSCARSGRDGAGVACHMGDDWPAIEAALREGRATPFARWAAAVEHGTQCELGRPLPGPISRPRDWGSRRHRRASWAVRRSWLCARALALEQSGITSQELAVVVGSGTGDVETHREVAARLGRTSGSRRVSRPSSPVSWPHRPREPGHGPRDERPVLRRRGGLAGGAYNLLLAAQLVEGGHIDAALAGGVDVADIHFHAGFDAMRAYTTRDNDRPDRASRPYAADRAGFVFSEGAGVLVLEPAPGPRPGAPRSWGHFAASGCPRTLGDMVAPCSEGAELAMRRALAHAGVSPGDVDYVNTHATSTSVGDVSEVRAMRRVFGERLVAYSSTKGYTGHPVSAAGPSRRSSPWPCSAAAS